MYVRIDLAYRVAYLLDNQGEAQLAQSDTTRSNVAGVLASWGYAQTPSGRWEATDILNAIDAVRHPIEPLARD